MVSPNEDRARGDRPARTDPSRRSSEPETEVQPPGTRIMALIRWVLVGLMAVIAAASVAYSWGLMPSESARAASVQYYCPMHPQIVQDGPGECPICSMSLVLQDGASEERSAPPSAASPNRPPAVRAEASGVPGLVPLQLRFDRVQLIGMRTATARRDALAAELRTVGNVAADEARLARVQTRVAGWVERLAVATTGQHVRRGQLLASVFSPSLLPAQQEFLAARRWAEARASAAGVASDESVSASQLEQGARARLELLGMSSQEIERVAAAGLATRTIDLIAPIDGTVTLKNAVQGGYAQPGSELYEIVDLSKVWVLADLYERDMGRVALGQRVDVAIDAYAGRRWSGKVGLIHPTLDAATRTSRVRIELDNLDGQLRPGMYARVTIRLSSAQGVFIPREALVDTGEHQYVFVAKEGGHFEPRRVAVGSASVGTASADMASGESASRDDHVQILSGLEAGEVVVTTGNFLLDSESRLRAAIDGTPESAPTNPGAVKP